MRIAQTIKGYGTEVATDLQHNITTLVGQETMTKVIEIGTFHGTGTTKAVIKGMKTHGFDYKFISIEVNPVNHKKAITNNPNTKGTEFWLGLSVKKSQLPLDFTFNVPDHIVVDHLPSVRNQLYRQEVDFNVPDNLLYEALKEMEFTPELVILDSAGHMGFIEFKYLMSLIPNHEFWLILDDIAHVKHYESFEYIKQHPEKYNIVWQSDQGEVHRSAIVQVSAD